MVEEEANSVPAVSAKTSSVEETRELAALLAKVFQAIPEHTPPHFFQMY